ncbi:MAG: adenylate/guanylate cyclase domain-containing protein [Alphaproteobacteria bacterium]|nr:adenylate/guanylate cyclase domain-containing protein [Alphaproteobacteria bacterium]
MEGVKVERRLAAILATDMVGYSRLMEADETGTISRQKAHRAELIDPTITGHRGRIVKTTGDGLLVEFASVVDAVACAVAVQRGMVEREAEVPEERRIRYRIGINLGDIVIDDDDIYGDGVNIAARLQELAETDGVCISGTAHEHLKSKVEVGYADLGEQQLKNIETPVRVYRVLMAPERAGELLDSTHKASGMRSSLAVAAALLVVVAGGGLWWWQAQPDFEPVDPAKMAFALPDKPSIAVLPFDNLSGDPTKDYVGDGLTENIIAVLSTSPDLVVIARNSSFTYKGKPVQVQEVAERFGVRYVLEGSVQHSGKQLRITAQLVDAVDGRHLWAERYDRELTDLFALQDDITQKILEAMHVELTLGEQAKRWREDAGDVEIYRLMVEGRAHFVTLSPAGHKKAERLWTAAYKRNPDGPVGNTLMGWVHWQKIFLGLSKDPEKDFAIAREFAEKSQSINEKNSNNLLLLATLDLYARNHESAVAYAERALELSPAGGEENAISGFVKSWSGQPAEGAELLKLGMRYEPDYPHWFPTALALSLMMLGRYDEAKVIDNGLLASPTDDVRAHPIALQHLAVMAMIEGDQAGARQFIERLLAIRASASIASAKREIYIIKDQAFVGRYLDALRQAGLPEQ